MHNIKKFKSKIPAYVHSAANTFLTTQTTNATKHTLQYLFDNIKEHFYPTIVYLLRCKDLPQMTEVIIRASVPEEVKKICSKNGELYHHRSALISVNNMNAFMFIQTPSKADIYRNEYNKLVITFLGLEAKQAKIRFINTVNMLNRSTTKIAINTLFYNTSNSKEFYWDINCKGIISKGLNEIFSDTDISDLSTYLKDWNKLGKMYDELNIVHKTGILLYGEPGTGKTSLAKAIAKELNGQIYIVNMENFNESQIEKIDEDINEYSSEANIILLEDIDCLFSTRDNLKTEKQQRSAQLLLQFLDGVFSIPNTIFVATTNHIESLDSALIRDGRFDLKIEMKNISQKTAIKMCKHFNLHENEINSLIEKETFPINPAYLQNQIVNFIIERTKNDITS